MKILLRSTGKWTDAEYEPNQKAYKTGENSYISESDIFSVQEEPEEAAKDYIKCNRCGEIIVNTPEEIEKHKRTGMEWSIDLCKGCKHYSTRLTETNTLKTERKEDGTLWETHEVRLSERCSCSWPTREIKSDYSKENCAKFMCRNAIFVPHKIFFRENHGVFDEIPVRTSLTPDKWVALYPWYYKRKGRYSISARVNKAQMIEYFSVSMRSQSARITYSAAQKEWYRMSNGRYELGLPLFVRERPQYLKALEKIVKEIYGDNAV